MKGLNGFLDDTYSAWLTMNCCASLSEAPSRSTVKPMKIEHDQPRLIPPPVLEPEERGREWVTRTKSLASRASSRGSFAVRRKLNAYNGPRDRRPRIGAPTDFRHVDNPVPRVPRRAEEFRPLELSIYMSENQLSPILPHFGTIDDLSFPLEKELPFPPPALVHSRTDSFRIPRKPLRSDSRASSDWASRFGDRPDSISTASRASLEKSLPRAPPAARLRSKTEPPAYERVKSAMHEKFELEQKLKDIEEIIEERKSIYFNSRPTSRATNGTPSIYLGTEEPMPLPPIQTSFAPVPLPPTASSPSFATRVSLPHADQRPKTAPSKTPVHIPTRMKSFSEASAAFATPSPSSDRSLPPPPPLPLVLQAPHPPLRKKKSFGRVSSWLFPSNPSTEHLRNISTESVTNTPKPVTSREGFYQCIDVRPSTRDRSTSVSTVSTMESDLDEPTVPSAWTPETTSAAWTPHSSPGHKGVVIRNLSIDSERGDKSIELERTRTFGEKEMDHRESWRMEALPVMVGPGRDSVGVAF